MFSEKFTLESQDGLPLEGIYWMPQTNCKAVVALVHGLGEHSGRYAHVADFFTQAGYAMSGFDLRGHGKSGGARGHAPNFEFLMGDIDRYLQQIGQKFPALPIFLYGHSLGGILVLNYVLRRNPRLAGVISTAAGLRTALEEQRMKLALVNTLASIFPTLSIPSGLDATQLSRDQRVVQAYQADALVHDRGTLIFAKEVFQAARWALLHASEFNLPLLVMHGTGDGIAYVSGSQDFANQLQQGVVIQLWEGFYHELHNEPEKTTVLNFMLDWMEKRYAASVSSG